ncbi:unnamed protein product [Haemonchus placei]|uniref:Helitron helicase n=1 Tax=Haemonchus placei TaxID=6290 RepID=A0A0N4W3M4_HAEPC|nr:unnamed protein product [Haemonchus placei]
MLRTPLMKTNRRTEVWMHWGSQADIEVDKADTDRQEWLCTERRQAGRQTDVDTSRQMDRGKQSDKYVREDADRQDTDGRHRHKWTDGDVDGRMHTKRRTRTDEDKHLQGRRMQRQRQIHNTDRQGQNTYLRWRSYPSFISSSSHVLDHSRPCGSVVLFAKRARVDRQVPTIWAIHEECRTTEKNLKAILKSYMNTNPRNNSYKILVLISEIR